LPPAQPMQQSQQAPQVAQNQPPQPSMTTAFNDFKSGDVKGGLSNVFGSLSGMAGSFDGGAAASAPAAPLQGPSQQQMQALSQILSGLGRRRNNQAEEVNMSSIYDWSLQAANNANSDDNINWAEGQPPSSVNNSARAMMQRIK
ncbi:hypothetical protein, partial [Bacillus sp. IG2]|uniref:hypothetical protein n=1 Tax=Bacillus sp. IG2 TaxID=3075931 RepID=UPI0028FC1C8E